MNFKYVCTFIFSSIFFCGGIWAQQTTNQEEQPQIIQTISVRKGEAQKTHDKAYYQGLIKDMDELIEAIEMKKTYVRSDQEEHERALKNGWYEEMERAKEDAIKQRNEYEIKLKTFN